jgi:uncharacterized membrane protein YbhN (UPF0104 family)
MVLLKKQSPWWGHLLRVGLGVLAIYLLIHFNALNPRLLKWAMTSHPLPYLEAFLLYIVVMETLAFLRWYWLLRAARVNVSAGYVFRLHLIGLFFSGFLPGGTGGDLVKGVFILHGRSKAEGAAAIGSMVVDRAAGTLGLLWFGTLTNLWNHELWETSPVLGAQAFTFVGASLASLILVLAYLSPWRPRRLSPEAPVESQAGFWKGLRATLAAFRDSPGLFAGVVGLSMGVHLFIVVVYALCARMLDISLPFMRHAYVVPTLTMLNGIPLSPAGLGFGEAGGKLLYKAVGMTHGHAEIPALFHSIVLLTALVCSPAYFFARWNNEKRARKEAAKG